MLPCPTPSIFKSEIAGRDARRVDVGLCAQEPERPRKPLQGPLSLITPETR